MAGHRALAAVGRSVVDLLNRRIDVLLATPPRPRAVLAGTADVGAVGSSPTAVLQFPALSVCCYKVDVDAETRRGWSAASSADGVPRVPLRMHLMVSAWDTGVESELEWLGLAAQILETESVLTGPLLHPSGDWRPGEVVQVVTDDVGPGQTGEAFQAVATGHRPSLLYLARVVIEGTAGGGASRSPGEPAEVVERRAESPS